MADRLDALPERVDVIERKLDDLSRSVDSRFEQVDQRFEQIDRRFDAVDEHFAEQRRYVEFAYERLDARMTAGFSRLDRKLDRLLTASALSARRRRPAGGRKKR